jgi:hypothetical protein
MSISYYDIPNNNNIPNNNISNNNILNDNNKVDITNLNSNQYNYNISGDNYESNSNIHENKPVLLNYDMNPSFELGVGVNDNTKNSNNIKDAVNYTYGIFDKTKTTEYLNENENRIWYWNYVGFLFSEGVILEAENRVVFNEVLEYFNKNNQYIYNYPNEFDNLIKTENSDIYVPFSLIKDDDLN